MADKVTKTGVGVVVVRNNKVLLGRRKSKLGHNEWGFPGGLKEDLETVLKAAERELGEETSLRAVRYEVLCSDMVAFHETDEVRYATLYVQAFNVAGEPLLMEPEKCYEWGWFDWFDPPIHLFRPTEILMESGFIPEGITETA